MFGLQCTHASHHHHLPHLSTIEWCTRAITDDEAYCVQKCLPSAFAVPYLSCIYFIVHIHARSQTGEQTSDTSVLCAYCSDRLRVCVCVEANKHRRIIATQTIMQTPSRAR